MTQPKRWLLAGLWMLLFIAAALLCLATGLWFGATFVQGVAEGLQSISTDAEGGARLSPLAADILHTAGTSFRFLPTGVVVLTAMHRGLPETFGKVIDNVVDVFKACVKFAAGTHSRAGRPDGQSGPAGQSGQSGQNGQSGQSGQNGQGGQGRTRLISTAGTGCFRLFVAASLVGSFGAVPPPAAPPRR